MKATIYSKGDSKVGLFPREVVIDTGLEADELEDTNDRAYARNHLRACFGELWDERAYVVFEDEDPDSGQSLNTDQFYARVSFATKKEHLDQR